MTEFDGYSLQYFSDPSSDLEAKILLSYNAKYVALLLFVKTGRRIPANAIGGVGLPVVHFPIAKFSTILDIIRNEKPLYVDLLGFAGSISTDIEPVGEQEPGSEAGNVLDLLKKNQAEAGGNVLDLLKKNQAQPAKPGGKISL
jgi:hypothetical protein